MVTRETGESRNDGSALQLNDPTEPEPAKRLRPRRITDLEGPLHRRRIGTSSDELGAALDFKTGPLGARGQVEALISEAPMNNNSGLEAVVERMAAWVASAAGQVRQDR